MGFRQLFDRDSSTYSYLLWDETGLEAIIIDPVREQAERDIQLIEELGLKLMYCLETHIHADHVMGGGQLRERLGCKIATHKNARVACADLWLEHGEIVEYGSEYLTVLHTPGHTNTDICYLSKDRVFTGDTLLIRGSGRTDFQSGDAGTAYDSIHDHLFTLPGFFKLYPAHDYNGFTVSTIAEEKRFNPRLAEPISREEYIQIMTRMSLDKPAKMDEAIPANMNCGLNQIAT